MPSRINSFLIADIVLTDAWIEGLAIESCKKILSSVIISIVMGEQISSLITLVYQRRVLVFVNTMEFH